MKEHIGKISTSTKIAVILTIALFLSLLLNAHLDLLYAKFHRLLLIEKGQDIQSVVVEIGDINRSLTNMTSQQPISISQKGKLRAEMNEFDGDITTLVALYHASNGGKLTALQNYDKKYLRFIVKVTEKKKLSDEDLQTFKAWKNIVGRQVWVAMSRKNHWKVFLERLNRATQQAGEKG